MIIIKRTYFKTHTVGLLTLPDGQEIYTLERPWLDNIPFISCIPEGEYIVKRDHTGKHRWYAVTNVKGRTAIEIHPATRVIQLEGCIAPCMYIDNGIAIDSIVACELLLSWFGESSWILRITT